jgi:C-terminal processing protease CtpA/Prc
VEGALVVAGSRAGEQDGGGLQVGDVIAEMDGVAVPAWIDRWRPYYAASNEPTRMRDMARAFTKGSCGAMTFGVSREGKAVTVTSARVPGVTPQGLTHDVPGDAFRRLSDQVAYLKLSSVKAAEAARYVESAAGTAGLIIDARNYPAEFVVFALGSLLVDRDTPFARFTTGDPVNPGAFHLGESVTLSPGTPHYGGKVVILVDEVTQSSAEYTAMAFRASPRAVIIGSTTAGADGNVSAIPLPGGLRTMISGIGVFYPDKRPTQRVGIVPDVETHPTLLGIRAGRDEVLEEAIRRIIGASAPRAAVEALVDTAYGRVR